MIKWIDPTTISSIFRDIAQVIFAAFVVNAFVMEGIDKNMTILGIFLSLVSWTFSLYLIKLNRNV